MLSNAIASSPGSPVALTLPTRAENTPFFSAMAADEIERIGLNTSRSLMNQARPSASSTADVIETMRIASALAISLNAGSIGMPTLIRRLPLDDSNSGIYPVAWRVPSSHNSSFARSPEQQIAYRIASGSDDILKILSIGDICIFALLRHWTNTIAIWQVNRHCGEIRLYLFHRIEKFQKRGAFLRTAHFLQAADIAQISAWFRQNLLWIRRYF